MSICREKLFRLLRQKQNNKKLIFQNRLIVFPLILITGGLFLVSNDMGIVRWYQLRHERNHVQMEIDRLILKEAELTNELDRLTNDKEYIKKIAREKFYMVKPGEKIFRVIDRRKIK